MPSRDIVENAWKAFASHDADRISAVFTEDAEWLAPPGNATALALGGSSHLVGRQGSCSSSPRTSPASSPATSR